MENDRDKTESQSPPTPAETERSAEVLGYRSPGAIDAAPAEAHPDVVYRVKQGGLAILLIGFGIWSVYHGFFLWPRQNQEDIERGQNVRHAGHDITINRGMAIALPPLGLYVLFRLIRLSRGSYRLENGVFHCPGHPPIPLSAIRLIDKSRWDRKGIALIDYELESGEKGQVRFDDFVFQRMPADAIFGYIEKSVPSDSVAE